MTTIEKNNEALIKQLHPDVRSIFIEFLTLCSDSGLVLQIYSAYRDEKKQKELYDGYIAVPRTNPYPAAPPGNSYHNYGLAIDIAVKNIGISSRDLDILQKAADIGKTLGIEWGGDFDSTRYKDKIERHHFQYTHGYSTRRLKQLKTDGFVDSTGKFPMLSNGKGADTPRVSAYQENISKPFTLPTYSVKWGSDIGDNIETTIESKSVISNDNDNKNINQAKDIINRDAPGIWQIVKLIIDKEVANKAINDMTIAFDQGSLLNFVNKVCQDPWVEFFSDTYGDKFYFIVRKPPFNLTSWSSLNVRTIREQDVINDNISWYDGEIYSWYQLIPQGTYISGVDDLYQFMPAMYFSEYAEIWGSKPYIKVSNYVEFSNVTDDKVVLEHEYDELKFLIQINNYLPFTRQGTITVNGDRKFRIGMKIYYEPTDEEFYIDSVSQSFSMSMSGPERVTTLQVSRGMVRKYIANEIENENSINYFNLMTFGERDEQLPAKQIEEQRNINLNSNFYCEDNLSTPIGIGQLNLEGILQLELIDKEVPSFRPNKIIENEKNINDIIDKLQIYPLLKLQLKGFIDSKEAKKDLLLALRRSTHLKNLIISRYEQKFPKDKKAIESLNARLIPENSLIIPDDDGTQLSLALNRKIEVVSLDMTIITQGVSETHKSLDWKVNRNVFQFFLNRLQFQNDSTIKTQ